MQRVIVVQVQLVATGEMSIICGCSGMSVVTSAGSPLASHPNSPSLFQGDVLDQEAFDLTPSVAVCSSSSPQLPCALAPLHRLRPFFFHWFHQVTVYVTRPLDKQKCLR